MSDISRYRQNLARTMASFQAASLSSKADSLGIPQGHVSAASSAQNFPHFSKLPTEIRLQIWRQCLPGPRAVEVHYGERSEFLCCKYPPPVALHICQESRVEALKRYELAFDSRPTPWRIYFDFSRDGLHFQSAAPSSIFPPNEILQTIKNDLAKVKFMSCCLYRSGSFPMLYLPDWRKFKALEQITLLIPPGGPDGPDRIFVDPSTVTLSPTYNFRAIEFLEQDRNQIVELWTNGEVQDFSHPRTSFMSYASGDYRIC